ncbi:MAG: hypothetical protein V4592_04495 [Bacteroidota bacterium]
MKKIQVLFIALSIAVVATSCYHGKHTTIVTNDGHNSTRIEYAGRIVFNDDNTGINSMAPNSYFKYKHNNEKLTAECDKNGHIVYELNDDNQTTALNEDGRRLLAEAVEQIAKAQRRK